jgi:ABC-type nitrate/sulfonate/bicarbonate transport system substrate-binding protein
LRGATAAAASACLPPISRIYAQTARNIRFALPWVAEGSNLFTYVAKNRGSWAKHGLTVEILRGSGSVAAAQAVGTGQFDFGMAAASAGILQSARGLPLALMGVCSYDATMGIGVLADSPIKAPKDLEGRKMASVVTSGEYPYLPAFANRAGFDLSKIDILQVDTQIRDRTLADRQVDAISAFAGSAIPPLAARGVNVRFMLFSQFGIPNYGNTLMTRPALIDSDPGLCAAVVDGAMEAIKFTLMQPKEAMDIFFKEVPEMGMTAGGKEQIRIGLGIWQTRMLSEIARKQGLGVADAKDMDEMIDLTMEYVVKDAAKPPARDAVMTNRFVGSVKLSDAEWQQAVAGSREFVKFLS